MRSAELGTTCSGWPPPPRRFCSLLQHPPAEMRGGPDGCSDVNSVTSLPRHNSLHRQALFLRRASERGEPWLCSAARLPVVGPSANPFCRPGLSLTPSGRRAPTTGPKGLQHLCTSYHPHVKTSPPPDRLLMVFHTLPSVSVS